ncbi:MAG TPA: ribosome maturation factor RimM [Magnetospirillaceae bacterium]|nr:ribosome maturation factor RimM [Magnetospirillaceae bacterium]
MPYTDIDPENGFLAIGRLGSPHGILGFLRVRSYSGETGHFASLDVVQLSQGEMRIEAHVEEVRVSGTEVFLRMAGCACPEDACRWTGWDILVPRRKAAPLKPGEHYIADLVGCDLVLGGRAVGALVAVVEGGEAPLLEVRTCEGRIVLIPFRGEFIGEVDTRARKVELLADWILG